MPIIQKKEVKPKYAFETLKLIDITYRFAIIVASIKLLRRGSFAASTVTVHKDKTCQ